jgi:hypothetical protein
MLLESQDWLLLLLNMLPIELSRLVQKIRNEAFSTVDGRFDLARPGALTVFQSWMRNDLCRAKAG